MQRDGTEFMRTWEVLPGATSSNSWQLKLGINNQRRVQRRKSEGSIVVLKPRNGGGAKGPWRDARVIRGNWS
jgi:predicted nuclease of restriction endonuclease-like RecB superfamily